MLWFCDHTAPSGQEGCCLSTYSPEGTGIKLSPRGPNLAGSGTRFGLCSQYKSLLELACQYYAAQLPQISECFASILANQ